MGYTNRNILLAIVDSNTYATTRVNQRNVYFGSGMTVSDIVYGERFYYDAVGNITSVYEGYTRTGNSAPLAMNGYTYDSLSQLKQEVMCFPLSSGAGIFYTYTYDFTYDGGGNITKITEKDSRQGNAVVAEKTLSYENTIWGDLLTSVTKGSTTHTLFYDGMGNPINYGNGDKLYTNLTWENGRELTSLTTGDITYTYAYDAEGIRTSKTVNGVPHTYITQNGKVVRETIGSGATAKVLDFIYDQSGRPFALRYSTNGGSSFTTYYYVLNLQGDVVRMVDASGTIVANYRYNAWGKLYSQSGTMAIMNPLRYRGYYYDTETGFYYLQSRYYDPANCRFINADCYTDTGTGFLGYNTFAYCNNNPILFSDSSGHIIEIEDDATEEEIAQYQRAVAYIKSSETGKKLIERLENSSKRFTIIFVDNDEMAYNCLTGNIYFDYDSGLIMKDKKAVQSAALGLAHEMGHAAQHLDGISLLTHPRAFVELHNLTIYETVIANELGEPIREQYNDAKGTTTMNNSTHFRTSHRRPWWFLPWNWPDSRKLTTDHNVA